MMKGNFSAAVLSVTLSSVVSAEPVIPERGTSLRSDILATARVIAGYDLGAPIEFVVNTILVDDDRAFINLEAQRPGGVPIDIEQTPMVLRDNEPPSLIDGPVLIAFLMQVDGTWYIDEFAIGATDVWWIGPPYCEHYASMLPDQACP